MALTGLDDAPIDIAVDLADQPMTGTGAGLTDQPGHAADSLFVLFHRERNALTRASDVRIGGRDNSFRAGGDPHGKHRFLAAPVMGPSCRFG